MFSDRPDNDLSYPRDFEILANVDCGHIRVVHDGPLGAQAAEQCKIVNGRTERPIYRLTGFSVQSNELCLRTAITFYPDYIRTAVLRVPRDQRWDALANPIGINCVCTTSDGYILLERRGTDVELYQRYYHVVGGYAVPEFDHSLGPDGAPVPDFAVSIRREMVEELGGIGPLSTSLQLSGLAYDRNFQHPEVCFRAHLQESLEVVRRRSASTPEFNDVFKLRDDAAELSAFLEKECANIVPTGKAALLLYGASQYGREWFTPVLRSMTQDHALSRF